MIPRIWVDPRTAEIERVRALRAASAGGTNTAAEATKPSFPETTPAIRETIAPKGETPGFVAMPCDPKNRRHFTYASLSDDEPGQWTIDSTGVLFQRCPKCGARQRLKYHSVDVHGTVEASVGCSNKPCDFHEMIQLDGWPHAQFKEAGSTEVSK